MASLQDFTPFKQKSSISTPFARHSGLRLNGYDYRRIIDLAHSRVCLWLRSTRKNYSTNRASTCPPLRYTVVGIWIWGDNPHCWWKYASHHEISSILKKIKKFGESSTGSSLICRLSHLGAKFFFSPARRLFYRRGIGTTVSSPIYKKNGRASWVLRWLAAGRIRRPTSHSLGVREQHGWVIIQGLSARCSGLRYYVRGLIAFTLRDDWGVQPSVSWRSLTQPIVIPSFERLLFVW